MGLDLSCGGHLTHGSPVNFSGKLYRATFYGVEEKTGRVNYDKVEETAKKEKPKTTPEPPKVDYSHLNLPPRPENSDFECFGCSS